MNIHTIHISLDLYSQFMESLGSTDGSVEAAWDFEKAEDLYWHNKPPN